ncbi:MAG: LysM peptidoglycan-binding domain-containing protein [Propionibacteriaceae bacterium]|nr:LysM peptidoglycan-binding domain-containing protein [Propionibacteriaceae bacterium]
MRMLKALAALLLLAALLVGVPLLLSAWGDPLALLDVTWSTALLRPDDGTLLLGVLSVLGWLAWALISVTAVVEVVAHLSRQKLRIQMPGINWLRPVVGALVAMALTPVLSSQADDPPPSVSTHAPLHAGKHVPSAAETAATPDPGVRSYTVQPGDELWAVAERQLGSGADWRSILQCNPGMTADTSLLAGSTIFLPADRLMAAAAAAPETVRRLTVQRGDTLWDLAREHLGDPQRWPELFKANQDIIDDPDEIDIGWQLSLPPSAGTAVADAAIAPEEEDPEVPTPPPPMDVEPGVPVEQQGLPTPTASVLIRPTSSAAPHARPDAVSTATHHPTSHRSDHMETVDDDASALDLLGPVGGMLAAGLVAGVAVRRHGQLIQRAVGRRITTVAPPLQRFFSALVMRSHAADPDERGLQPTSVVLGWRGNEDVIVELEHERCMLIAGTEEMTSGMAATVLTSLSCAEWSSSVEMVLVQPHEDWSNALDEPRLTTEADPGEALAHLQRLCAQRRLQLGHSDLNTERADADRASVWAPVVFVFCQSLHPGQLDHIRDCLSLGRVGVSVVATAQPGTDHHDSSTLLAIESGTLARLGAVNETFEPQLLNQPARHAVMSLFASAVDEDTEPAPWWRDGAPAVVTNSPNVAEETPEDNAMPAWSHNPDHPTLLVLGPVDLIGTRGTLPTRAVGQCMEYCAWLLMHPGSTPTAMVRELLVAEGTRRSNMSRLRTWLGNDPMGSPYLPDAYSGHIALAPQVTSDWEHFQSLLAGGVNRSSTPLLRQALSLVRGCPLDGVTFQWPWAASWLTDMLGMISDAAVVLADRCTTQGELDDALWAISQGQLAMGDDETLAIRRIVILALQGRHDEVTTAVTKLTRTTRIENRDLCSDSVQRIQHALHLNLSAATRR